MKTLISTLFLGGALVFNSYAQNTDSLKIEQNKKVYTDFKEFVKEKGELNPNGIGQKYIYNRGCKNINICGYFYSGQLHKDTIKEDLVINFSIPDSIAPNDQVYSQSYYYFADEGANGLDDDDYYFSYKSVKNKQTKSFLSLRILEYKITKFKGKPPYGTPLKDLSEKDKQKAYEDYYFVMKEIMHDAIYKEY